MIIKTHTAILAKEKGFDLPVLGYYLINHEDGTEIMDYEEYNDYGFPNRFIDHLRNNFNNAPIEFDIEYLSAPYLSELQSWLINTHKIKVLPILRTSGKYSYDIYHYDTPNSIGKHTRHTSMNSWDDFNECFESGLYEGLELITNNIK